MNLKIIFAGVSSVIGIICFIPYIRDIFRNKTKPHSYTWFIWVVLQIIAAAAMWSAGAGVAIASSVIGAMLCSLIFILSLKRGTKNITKFDTVCLLGALIALTAYVFLHDPLLSIIFITLTDTIGVLPTLRKAYYEPYTETASTHLLSSVSGAFAIAALARFTLTTSLYLIVVLMSDALLGLLALIRRKFIPQKLSA